MRTARAVVHDRCLFVICFTAAVRCTELMSYILYPGALQSQILTEELRINRFCIIYRLSISIGKYYDNTTEEEGEEDDFSIDSKVRCEGAHSLCFAAL